MLEIKYMIWDCKVGFRSCVTRFSGFINDIIYIYIYTHAQYIDYVKLKFDR